MPLFADLKRQGDVAKMLFLARATALGLTVSKPFSDSAKYDFLVDASGLITRVQVKSVSVTDRGAYHVCCAAGLTCKRAYTAADIDLLVVYIFPEDAWYLIPVAAFTPHKGFRLRPGSANLFEHFRDAWRLLFPQVPTEPENANAKPHAELET